MTRVDIWAHSHRSTASEALGNARSPLAQPRAFFIPPHAHAHARAGLVDRLLVRGGGGPEIGGLGKLAPAWELGKSTGQRKAVLTISGPDAC